MGDIVEFRQRHRAASLEIAKVTKIIDGKPVEFVDVDSLSLIDRERYFSGNLFSAPRSIDLSGAPNDVTPLC